MISLRQVFLLPVLSISCFVGNDASKACTGVVGTKWQPDRTDCSYFHLCRGGNGVRLPCPWNTVTNAQLEACVPKGSKMDTCTSRQSHGSGLFTRPPYFTRSTFQRTARTTSTPSPLPSTRRPATTTTTSVPFIQVSISSRPDTTLKTTTRRETTRTTMTPRQTIQTQKWVTVPPQSVGASQSVSPPQSESGKIICTQRLGDIILVPDNCAKFINCSGGSGYQIEECPFPLVLDQVRRQCTDRDRAVCGQRPIPKDPCELNGNCQSGQQSCRGRPDGFNPWRLNFISSSFVICANQHVVYKGTCPSNVTVTVFDPARRMCTELKMNAGRF